MSCASVASTEVIRMIAQRKLDIMNFVFDHPSRVDLNDGFGHVALRRSMSWTVHLTPEGNHAIVQQNQAQHTAALATASFAQLGSSTESLSSCDT